MEKDLTRGKPARVLLRFALPVIGGNLFQLFYTLADSVIVGRTLGADALAAVGSTSIIIYLVLCFIQGFTGGFGICLGQRFGAKDQSGMERSVRISWLLSLFFTVVLTVVCCLLAHPILRWMQTPDAIYADAYDYVFVILLGTGATIFYNMISNMLRALGDSRTPVISGGVLAGQCGAGCSVYRPHEDGRCRCGMGNGAQSVDFRCFVHDRWSQKLSRHASTAVLPFYEGMAFGGSGSFENRFSHGISDVRDVHRSIGDAGGGQRVGPIGDCRLYRRYQGRPVFGADEQRYRHCDSELCGAELRGKTVRPYSGGRSSGTLSVDDRQCADGRVNARLPQAGGFSVYRRTDRSRGGICRWLFGSGRAILSAAWLPVGIPFRRAKHGGQSLAVYGLHGGTSAANRCNDVPFPTDRLYRRMSGQPAGLARCDLSADPRVLPAHEATDPRCVNLHEKGVSCIIGNGLTV